MFELEWDEDISIGNQEIDNQHQHLFEIANRLIATSNNNWSSSFLSNILTELRLYANYHFSDEEEFMRLHNYPLLEEHIKEHKEFLYRIGKFHIDLIDKKESLKDELISYVLDWLISHTCGADQDYKYYI